MRLPPTDCCALRATSIFGLSVLKKTRIVFWAALSNFGAPLENLSKQDFLTPGTVVQSLGLKKCKKGKNEIKYALYHLCSQSHTSTRAHNVRLQNHHHRSTSRRDAKEVR